MQLKKLNSYRKDVNTLKYFLIAIIVVTVGFNAYIYYNNMAFLEREKDKVIVIDPKNNAYLARATLVGTRSEERKFQYMDHVADFYGLFYGFDRGNIDDNIERALALIGTSGEDLYREYRENNIIRLVKENNWKTRVMIERIEIDMSKTPVGGVVYARQKLIRPGGESERHLNATFEVYDVAVSYENPHGAMIDNFDIFNNTRITLEEDEK